MQHIVGNRHTSGVCRIDSNSSCKNKQSTNTQPIQADAFVDQH